MPYITEGEKQKLDADEAPQTVGQLTYVVTRACNRFARDQGKLRYITIALVMGALFCAAMEFYRRVAVPYENGKLAENGDVYS